MTERLNEMVKIISELMVGTAARKDPEALLEIAIATRQLFRAIPGAEKQRRSALYSIENALSLLIPREESVGTIDLSKLKCSFCGRQEPEVMLGAGADAFICDDCVGLFTEMFREKKKQSQAPNKAD